MRCRFDRWAESRCGCCRRPLDELLPLDHPAQFVAEFVDALGRDAWAELGVEVEGDSMGAPAYHPRALLSVWLYGFMTGVRSCRKLEAACRDQIPYLWLTGWQHPDHNTLWRFYKGHRQAMRNLFERTVRTAVAMKLVDLAVQAADGTKVVANASVNRSYDAEGLRRLLDRLERAITDLEAQNEAGEETAAARLPEELAGKEVLREQVRQAMADLGSQKRHKRINLTDKDARLMKGKQGIVAGYNAQTMVSPVEMDGGATGIGGHRRGRGGSGKCNALLAPMMEQSEETTGAKSQMILADAGYFATSHLAECDRRGQRWCRRQDRSSSKTRITRTDSPMTSVATALRVHRDRRSRSSVYSMRTESPCDGNGLPPPSARRARPPEAVQGRRRLGEVWP